MISAHSIIVIATIIIVLSGTALGTLILLVTSMHRTTRLPLSEVHCERAGAISRRVLVGARTNGTNGMEAHQ